ncbi:MAG: hypothetical protein IT233_14155 [Bacteroidia bacterium]|nr:hypothetical protein [Bacteroidia bacterium]
MSQEKYVKVIFRKWCGLFQFLLLLCPIPVLSQGDIANTHPPGLWENKVSLIRIITPRYDSTTKREIVYTAIKVIQRPDKTAPQVKPKDSTEFIART